jgi:hypothetical protein
VDRRTWAKVRSSKQQQKNNSITLTFQLGRPVSLPLSRLRSVEQYARTCEQIVVESSHQAAGDRHKDQSANESLVLTRENWILLAESEGRSEIRHADEHKKICSAVSEAEGEL